MNRRVFVSLALALAVSFCCCEAQAKSKKKKTPKTDAPKYLVNPYANPSGDPSLPNVLLIGDSISIGYTIPVRKLLAGKANVFRPSVNCRYSSYGVEKVKSWLGKRKWDVIHFNWGIWDTHCLREGKLVRGHQEHKYPPEELKIRCSETEYIENLKKILPVLEATGAKLIWTSTTPVLSRPKKRIEDIPRYNRLAARLMQKRGIPIDDLYGFVLPNVDKWQTEDRCHYNKLGCEKLGEQVAGQIEEALRQRAVGSKQRAEGSKQ